MALLLLPDSLPNQGSVGQTFVSEDLHEHISKHAAVSYLSEGLCEAQ